MAAKRTIHQDPEYDAISSEVQEKRIKLLEDSGRRQTEKKIEAIIKSNIDPEVAKKHEEIDSIDEAIHEARYMIDRLRACIITKYYANLVQEQVQSEQGCSSIHPTVKKYFGKSPKQVDCNTVDRHENSQPDTSQTNGNLSGHHKFQFNNQIQSNDISNKLTSHPSVSKSEEVTTRAPRFKRKCKVIIGNTSKFIPVWQRDQSDQSTHKWMVYVRGDKDHPNIESFVKKVRFLLHPSYRPSDIVEICNPPFHLIKRGWGEFPVRVQLHFHDPRNKPVDIIHNLKLDKTFTGLQTLGHETVVEVQIFKPDESKVTSNGPFSFTTASQSSGTSSENSASAVTCNGSVSSDNSVQEQDVNLNVHTIIKKEPDSLVMNIKLPKTVTNEQTSSVNNHKIILPSNDTSKSSTSAETNSEKKTVPKIVISNNRITTKCSTKPFTVINGMKTTVVKCRDSEGNVLLVPPSSLTFKPPPNLANQNAIQPNSFVNSTSTDGNNVPKTVPSYFVTLVPSQTKGGQKPIYLIPLNDKKTKKLPVKPSEVTKVVDVKPQKMDAEEKSESVSDVALAFKKNPRLLYRFELESIKLEYCKTFEDLLKKVCKIFPLVKKDVDRSVLTFCARSIEEFHTWNIGKQKASEWRRAGRVRKAILKLLKKKGCTHITADSVWSQSRIMTWCRKNGFVPMATEKVTLLPEPKWSGVELCSLNTADDLISTLQEEKYTSVADEDEEEIDIINVIDKKPLKSSIKTEEGTCYLPHLSDSAAFVKHTASQLSIDFKPVELEPGLYFPLIEEVLLSAVKQFAADIVGASLNEGFNRLGGKICPEEVTVSDVYSAVKNNPKFDFCSNSYLGLPKDSTGNT